MGGWYAKCGSEQQPWWTPHDGSGIVEQRTDERAMPAQIYLCPTCRRILPPSPRCTRCGGALDVGPPAGFVGQSMGGYRLEAILGAGAMGAVYVARRAGDTQPVALKMMVPDDDDEATVKRFLQEAQLSLELRHPNVVEVSGCAPSEWGTPFYTMELLRGRSLREELRERPQGFPPDQVLRHVRQIAAGLLFAHQHGVIHRDLKPENVFLVEGPDGPQDKILDFGLAKTVIRPRQTRLTRSGILIGTPTYVAPEQVVNKDLGPHTDQYALALITAELYTGKKVRQGHTVAQIVVHDIQRPIPDDVFLGTDVPPPARDALVRATQPLPAERFPDVGAFARALEATAAGTAAVLPSDVAGTPRSAARRRWIALLIALGVAGAIAAFLLLR